MTRLCSASDRLGFVRSRNRSKQWTDKLFTIVRLKTSVKLHIDLMMRTRNEVVERGSFTKSQKGKKACVERIVGECFHWKAHAECSTLDSCRFSHDQLAQGDSCSGQRRKGRSSFPAPNSKAKTDGEGETSSKNIRQQGGTLFTTGAKFHADIKIVKTRHVNFGILPCVKTTSLRPDAYMEENVASDMLRLRRCPAISQRKMVRMGSQWHVRNRQRRIREGPELELRFKNPIESR